MTLRLSPCWHPSQKTTQLVMKNRLCGQFAITLLGCTLSIGLAEAACGDINNASNPCRYPAGDAWCAAKHRFNRYAYKDDCGPEKNQTESRIIVRPPTRSISRDPVAVWNCAKAKTVVERLICNNPDLRTQDAWMGSLYTELQALGQTPERSQQNWLKNHRNPCRDTDCLRSVYADRIRDFESLVSRVEAAGEPPATVAPTIEPPVSAPEQTARPSLTDAEAPDKALATRPGPELTPANPIPGSQKGIPDLPQPEAPFPNPSGHHPQPDQSPPSSISGEPLVLGGAVALAMAVGLFAWRRRARIRPALVSDRSILAPFTRRWRTRLDTWASDE